MEIHEGNDDFILIDWWYICTDQEGNVDFENKDVRSRSATKKREWSNHLGVGTQMLSMFLTRGCEGFLESWMKISQLMWIRPCLLVCFPMWIWHEQVFDVLFFLVSKLTYNWWRMSDGSTKIAQNIFLQLTNELNRLCS